MEVPAGRGWAVDGAEVVGAEGDEARPHKGGVVAWIGGGSRRGHDVQPGGQIAKQRHKRWALPHPLDTDVGLDVRSAQQQQQRHAQGIGGGGVDDGGDGGLNGAEGAAKRFPAFAAAGEVSDQAGRSDLVPELGQGGSFCRRHQPLPPSVRRRVRLRREGEEPRR